MFICLNNDLCQRTCCHSLKIVLQGPYPLNITLNTSYLIAKSRAAVYCDLSHKQRKVVATQRNYHWGTELTFHWKPAFVWAYKPRQSETQKVNLTFRFMAGISIIVCLDKAAPPWSDSAFQLVKELHEKVPQFLFLHKLLSKPLLPSAQPCKHKPCDSNLTRSHVTPAPLTLSPLPPTPGVRFNWQICLGRLLTNWRDPEICVRQSAASVLLVLLP